MQLLSVAPQTAIITQGHSGLSMYIIKKGFLNVVIINDSGQEKFISKLSAPDFFGELSCLSGSKCAASIRTAEHCELWQIDRSHLDDVSEEDKLAYIAFKKAQYAAPANNVSLTQIADDDALNNSFGVCMWFYQIAGIMLSVTSPLSYVDGSAVAYSIVSFVVNDKPSSEAASDVAQKGSASDDASSGTAFQFCVDPAYSFSQLHATSYMYYLLWALMIAILARRRVWRVLRGLIISVSFRFAKVLDLLSNYFSAHLLHGNARSPATLQEQFVNRRSVDIEIRGPVILKWLISCFNAVAILLMQGTACIQLSGFPDAAGTLRWIYDGRVVCFSDDGDLPGSWQAASAIGVAFALMAPAALWRLMVRIQKVGRKQTPFEESLVTAYSGPHSANARHWMVVM